MSTDTVIKVQNLTKKYTLQHAKKDAVGAETKDHWALKNVSFDIKRGESVGIIGPNGSGKSTLLKILSGVTKPTSGSVEIIGRVASILDIGAGFHPELCGRENVFLNGQLLGFSKKEIKDKYHEIVDFSGIEGFIEEPVKNYSNGMYLRLAFSILAHLDFDIYLFDEVMSVGDASFQIKVNQFLENKRKKNHSTFVFVSHQLAEVQKSCNQIYLLNNGTVSIDNFSETIDSYMSSSFDKSDLNLPSNEAVFKDDGTKENEYFFLKKVWVENPKNGVNMLFCAEILMHSHCNVDVSFSVESLIGNELFYVSTLVNSTQKIDKNGLNKLFVITAEVPNNVLTYGKYVLCITLLANKKTMVNRLKSCTFNLLKTKNILLDERPNIPLVNGNWTVTKKELIITKI